MKANQVLEELKSLGRPSIKKVLLNHSIGEPLFGVKISDLKILQKRIGKDHSLALALYDSGIYDAMYLAGLIADDARMTKTNLRHWAARATCGALAGTTVAWVAAGSPQGWDLALEWIESPADLIRSAGWATLASLVSVKPDAELNLPALRKLLHRAATEMGSSADRTRYQMNGFLIAVGTHVAPLTEAALQAAGKVGTVDVDFGNTACQVPDAAKQISKVQAAGRIGKKRKTAKC
jgi:3-methyladenine DNA glycosylase AlkD